MELGAILMYVTTYFGLFTAIFFFMTLLENRKSLKSPKPTRLPKVTIAVPAYNEENTIAGTVKSLLAMKYPKNKLEIYVINDGSSDNTLKEANKFKKYGVKVIDKPNSGKADSLNQVIKKCKGEFFGALDADSFAHPEAIKRLVGYFSDPKIMAVTPSMMVFEPKGFLQKIQYIEYLMGVYLRKIVAFLGSIHVTPGPLSLYRVEFFEKYGGYALNNRTEDIEMALRIQKKGYQIENAIDAYVFTVSPRKFVPLTKQRERWYSGFLQNVLAYKSLFSRKYGNLGLFILPASFLSIILVIFAAGYALFSMGRNTWRTYTHLRAVNFEFWRMFDFRLDFFYWDVSMIMFLSMITLVIGIFIICLAKYLANRKESIAWSYILFMIFYWILFAYWWVISAWACIRKKKIQWGIQYE